MKLSGNYDEVLEEQNEPKYSNENKGSIGNWTRGHLCYLLAKNIVGIWFMP